MRRPAFLAVILWSLVLMTGISESCGSMRGFASAADNGLLLSRTNPWRTQTIGGRDRQGRILAESDILGGAGGPSPLAETQTWRADAKLASYHANRTGTGAWEETRTYVSYDEQGSVIASGYNPRGQLLSEPFSPAADTAGEFAYQFDFNGPGGPSVRTSAQYTTPPQPTILGGDTIPGEGGEDAFLRAVQESDQAVGSAAQSIGWQYDGNGNVSDRSVAGGSS